MLNEDLIGKIEFYDFLTGKASTAISRRMQRNLKEVGIHITSEQWSVLYNLWLEEGLTQQELAIRTFRDKPSITRLVNNLEKLNLVIRVNDKDDRRSNLIYLTKTARKWKELGMSQANRTIAEALEGVSAEFINMAQVTLQQVLTNLKK